MIKNDGFLSNEHTRPENIGKYNYKTYSNYFLQSPPCTDHNLGGDVVTIWLGDQDGKVRGVYKRFGNRAVNMTFDCSKTARAHDQEVSMSVFVVLGDLFLGITAEDDDLGGDIGDAGTDLGSDTVENELGIGLDFGNTLAIVFFFDDTPSGSGLKRGFVVPLGFVLVDNAKNHNVITSGDQHFFDSLEVGNIKSNELRTVNVEKKFRVDCDSYPFVRFLSTKRVVKSNDYFATTFKRQRHVLCVLWMSLKYGTLAV